MLPALLTILAGVAITLAVVGIVFVLGLRDQVAARHRPGRRAAAAAVMNPRQLRRAGRPGAYASIIRHLGRRTGRPYETPVGVVADGDGFLIVLPYGRGTQWLRNVLAAGEATLVTEGRTVPGRPPGGHPDARDRRTRLSQVGPARGPAVRDGRLPAPAPGRRPSRRPRDARRGRPAAGQPSGASSSPGSANAVPALVAARRAPSPRGRRPTASSAHTTTRSPGAARRSAARTADGSSSTLSTLTVRRLALGRARRGCPSTTLAAVSPGCAAAEVLVLADDDLVERACRRARRTRAGPRRGGRRGCR